MTPGDLHPGDIIHIGPNAGGAIRQMYARVIRVNPWPAWPGMAWLDVHESDAQGRVLEDERMAYVRLTAIRMVRTAASQAAAARDQNAQARRPRNDKQARVPRQRTSPETTRTRNGGTR
jgi:hypothetical protein